MKHFQPRVAQNPIGPLMRVKQTSFVMQYQQEFELTAASMRQLDHEVKIGIFLNGLKNEIQAKLKVSQFRTLSALMYKVLELEVWNQARREGGIGMFNRWGGNFKGTSS